MDYEFQKIEEKWQKIWKDINLYKVEIDHDKPKFYVLDMFPYPSGAGLHVGHPLGYIASDIYSRYKRLKGFNVLHPMGYDAYGLPAEQYAIQTGQHPAITTDVNIKRYRQQLDKIGFSFDWSREVKTCDPKYYKWTQWVFLQLFGHWYNYNTQKAEPVDSLTSIFEKQGTEKLNAACTDILNFSAAEWKSKNEKEKQEILLNYRIAYLADTMVNWCPALGTVLANDEVKDGYSVRGGHPVVQKEMKQWSLRISAYAQRLLDGLDTINWSESLKEIQKNWIGRSEGAEVLFDVAGTEKKLLIFTTRPDTIYGATFMVLAPEHELVSEITTEEYKQDVLNYIEETQKRTERERMAETKKVSGQFTGAYAMNPFTHTRIPIWISDYVLAGYGTGAIMAVPAHDSRDYAFAKHFEIPIIEVISGGDISQGAFDSKDGIVINSDIINGLKAYDAIAKINDEIEKLGIGKRKINYRLRDAIFSRQRYWGEPFPIYFKEGLPYPFDESKLPLELPEIDAYLPTEKGEPPLGRALNWKTEEGYPIELSTMPGFAGSSAYYLRYMDPQNDKALVSKEANNYWKDVDLYVGGAEHATGHLIYARFWNKFLFDLGIVCEDEPFKKLVNQGMIQGRSNFVYRIKNTNLSDSKACKFVSLNRRHEFDTTEIHVDINIVNNDILDIELFKKSNPEYANAEFIYDEDGKYRCGWAVEKMSKSMYNVVNPDDVIEKYGADTLRMYEMFLGPIELSKPWDTNGIDGVHKFLKKLWRLFYGREGAIVTDEEPIPAEYKILHKTIKKIQDDIEGFSFNTSVSAFMICVNELTDLNCHKRKILEPLLIILSPFAPHIAEELWEATGHKESVVNASFPAFNPTYLVEDTFEYPVSFNGKMRFKLSLPLDKEVKEIEEEVLKHELSQRWLDGKPPKKIIVVKGKIINVVV